MADWLGLKITPSQRRIWEKESAGGKWNFVLRRGLFVGIYCAVLYCLQYWLTVPRENRNVEQILTGAVFLLVAGMCWGLFTWRALRKRFSSVDSN
jgi:hypothetical protein